MSRIIVSWSEFECNDRQKRFWEQMLARRRKMTGCCLYLDVSAVHAKFNYACWCEQEAEEDSEYTHSMKEWCGVVDEIKIAVLQLYQSLNPLAALPRSSKLFIFSLTRSRSLASVCCLHSKGFNSWLENHLGLKRFWRNTRNVFTDRAAMTLLS